MSMKKNTAELQNPEIMMQKKAMAIEKINAYMQKLKTMEKKFDPLSHFSLHRVLSQESPQFYTEDELAQIEKINHIVCQEANLLLISQSRVKKVEVNDKKRCRSSNEDIMSDGGRRVKSKSTIKRKPIIRKKETVLSPPPELPNHVNNMIKVLNGSDIKYIMCKELYKTDLNPNNNRLSMPISQIKYDFLTEIEKTSLKTRDQEGKPFGLKVTVLDPCFNEFSLSLKKWDMTSTSIYNLHPGWTPVLLKNNFKEHQKLDIWSFRVNGKLHLLLNDNESQEIEKDKELKNSTAVSKTEE
ncbi:putative B3 domain-containing protein At2g27410 [Vicia villosa]|uniref:putative B3 domain-containing protein At2g27410 n=1 Tax=Vicia villosa TaxID=3911 RepID=UPI00273B2BE2|nr:putative B3 domain-containing protein At2g27410 [Vicia villosa]XP_058781984.1 putative B3 domain-containing protein At2g27410 [Vicia villosa]